MTTTSNSDSTEHTTDKTPIVVGVDGSHGNDSAIAWATHEAEQTGRGVLLVAAASIMSPVASQVPDAGWMDADVDTVSATTDKVASAVATEHPSISISHRVETGDALSVLLGHASVGPIVVGRRGLSAFDRLTVGSVSIAVAGRSPVPVVVVPDNWDPEAHVSEPVVVGVDLAHEHAELLEAAFERADAAKVPLVVVSGWLTSPLLAWSPRDIEETAFSIGEVQRTVLAPFREKYPNVTVDARHPHAHRAGAVLDAAKGGAQLIVLGRRTKASRATGFGPGSMTRAILHYTESPVLVVPS